MRDTSIATQAIQAILAPAVMVSASALFLLGLNARYVALITRIRLLNDERRELVEHLKKASEREFIQDDRLLSIEHQLKILRFMAWHSRSAILCQILAAILFVLTSCSIGFYFITAIPISDKISILLFMIGLLLSLSGIIFLGIDIFKSYKLIVLEIGKR